VGREPRVLPRGSPDQGSQGENSLVGFEHVHVVPCLVPTRQGQKLVGGEVHVVELKAAGLVSNGWHEAPGRIMGPIDPRAVVSPRHHGAHVSWEGVLDIHVESPVPEEGAVSLECLRHPALRVVEEVQVLAEPGPAGRRVNGPSAGQVAGSPRGGRATPLGRASGAQCLPGEPRLPISVLHELEGDPLYVSHADLEVRGTGPEAQGVKAPVGTAGLPNRHHSAGRFGIEGSTARRSSLSSDLL